jgi:hypothetical protein
MSASYQWFTLTQNMKRGFLLCSAPPAQGTVSQPHYIEMSSQDVMYNDKVHNYTRLHPTKGH